MPYIRMKRLFLRGLLWLYLLLEFGYMALSLEPGYLDFDNLPDTNFSCLGKVIGGYYADLETNCQMFHVCTIGQLDEPMDIRFLCLNGTVFDQETRVCERIDEVDCSKSERFYGLNLELYGNTQPPTLEDSPETEQPLIIKSTTTTTPTTTSKPKATNTPFYTSAKPPSITTQGVAPHHFSVANSPDIRFNPEEINISLHPGAPPDIRTKPATYQQQSYSDNNKKVVVTTHSENSDNKKVPVTTHSEVFDNGKVLQSEDFGERPQTQTPRTQKPQHHNFGHTSPQTNKNFHHSTPSDINYEFTFRQTEPNFPDFHTELPQNFFHSDFLSDQDYAGHHHSPQSQQFKSSTFHDDFITTTKGVNHFQQKVPTTVRNFLQSLKPPAPNQPHHYNNHQTEKPQRVQLPLPLLPTLPPLTFSSPAPFALQHHIDTKRYTKDHPSPPRIVISASASVSDASGRRLNYSLGTIGAAEFLEQPPHSYDEYKDEDVGLDPFFHDVPKLKRSRTKRQTVKHSDIIRNEEEAVNVLKFLIDWYKNNEKTATESTTLPTVITTTPRVVKDIKVTPTTVAQAELSADTTRAGAIKQNQDNFGNSDLFNRNSKFTIIGSASDQKNVQERRSIAAPTKQPTKTTTVKTTTTTQISKYEKDFLDELFGHEEDYVNDNFEPIAYNQKYGENEKKIDKDKPTVPSLSEEVKNHSLPKDYVDDNIEPIYFQDRIETTRHIEKKVLTTIEDQTKPPLKEEDISPSPITHVKSNDLKPTKESIELTTNLSQAIVNEAKKSLVEIGDTETNNIKQNIQKDETSTKTSETIGFSEPKSEILEPVTTEKTTTTSVKPKTNRRGRMRFHSTTEKAKEMENKHVVLEKITERAHTAKDDFNYLRTLYKVYTTTPIYNLPETRSSDESGTVKRQRVVNDYIDLKEASPSDKVIRTSLEKNTEKPTSEPDLIPIITTEATTTTTANERIIPSSTILTLSTSSSTTSTEKTSSTTTTEYLPPSTTSERPSSTTEEFMPSITTATEQVIPSSTISQIITSSSTTTSEKTPVSTTQQIISSSTTSQMTTTSSTTISEHTPSSTTEQMTPSRTTSQIISSSSITPAENTPSNTTEQIIPSSTTSQISTSSSTTTAGNTPSSPTSETIIPSSTIRTERTTLLSSTTERTPSSTTTTETSASSRRDSRRRGRKRFGDESNRSRSEQKSHSQRRRRPEGSNTPSKSDNTIHISSTTEENNTIQKKSEHKEEIIEENGSNINRNFIPYSKITTEYYNPTMPNTEKTEFLTQLTLNYKKIFEDISQTSAPTQVLDVSTLSVTEANINLGSTSAESLDEYSGVVKHNELQQQGTNHENIASPITTSPKTISAVEEVVQSTLTPENVTPFTLLKSESQVLQTEQASSFGKTVKEIEYSNTAAVETVPTTSLVTEKISNVEMISETVRNTVETVAITSLASEKTSNVEIIPETATNNVDTVPTTSLVTEKTSNVDIIPETSSQTVDEVLNKVTDTTTEKSIQETKPVEVITSTSSTTENINIPEEALVTTEKTVPEIQEAKLNYMQDRKDDSISDVTLISLPQEETYQTTVSPIRDDTSLIPKITEIFNLFGITKEKDIFGLPTTLLTTENTLKSTDIPQKVDEISSTQKPQEENIMVTGTAPTLSSTKIYQSEDANTATTTEYPSTIFIVRTTEKVQQDEQLHEEEKSKAEENKEQTDILPSTVFVIRTTESPRELLQEKEEILPTIRQLSTQNLQRLIEEIEENTKSVVAATNTPQIVTNSKSIYTVADKINRDLYGDVKNVIATTERRDDLQELTSLFEYTTRSSNVATTPEIIVMAPREEKTESSTSSSTTEVPQIHEESSTTSSIAAADPELMSTSQIERLTISESPLKTTPTTVTTTIASRRGSNRRGGSRAFGGRNSEARRGVTRHRFSTESFTKRPDGGSQTVEDDIINELTKSSRFATTESYRRRLRVRPNSGRVKETSTDAPLQKSASPTQPERGKESLPTTPLSKEGKGRRFFIFNCFGKEVDKFYPDPRDCRLFHYCTQGYNKNQLIDMKFVCDLNTYFDDAKLICSKRKPRRCM